MSKNGKNLAFSQNLPFNSSLNYNMNKIIFLKLVFLLNVIVFFSSCSEPDLIMRYTETITIENQCSEDITIIYKTLKFGPDRSVLTGETDTIIEEKIVIHRSQSMEINVYYKEHKQYYNNEIKYNKTLKINYIGKTKEFNFEPFVEKNTKLIVNSADFA